MATGNNGETLESWLNKATDPSNPEERWDCIQTCYQLINTQTDGPQVAVRLLAHKIQSPQAREALQALTVLEACMNNCGQRFHSEATKFRFLNEMIKVLSPKYLGQWCPEEVKTKVIEVLYSWTLWLQDQPKIQEAYSMLKKQGLVKKDPKLPVTMVTPPPSPRADESVFDQEDKAKLLARLLKSNRPEDLQTANRLIKNTIKEEQDKAERESRRVCTLEEVDLCTRELRHLLDTHTQHTDHMKTLYERCDRLRPSLFRLASDTVDDDSALAQILSANDELTQVVNAYRARMATNGKAGGGARENGNHGTGGCVSPREIKSYHLIDLSALDSDSPPPPSLTPPPPSSLLPSLTPPPPSLTPSLSSLTPPPPSSLLTPPLPSLTPPPSSSLLPSLTPPPPSSLLPHTSLFSPSLTPSHSRPRLESSLLSLEEGLSELGLDDLSQAGPPRDSYHTDLLQLSGTGQKVSKDAGTADETTGRNHSFTAGVSAERGPCLLARGCGGEGSASWEDPRAGPLSQLISWSGSNGRPMRASGSNGQPMRASGSSSQPMRASGSNSQPMGASGSNSQPMRASGSNSQPMRASGSNSQPMRALGSNSQPMGASGSNSQPMRASGSPPALADVYVPLESIKPSGLEPLTLFDQGGVHVSLHFARDTPPGHPHVAVVIVSTVNTSALPVKDFLFQAAVPKTMQVKLQPASGRDLPPYMPLLPPAALSQTLLLANPQRRQLRLRYRLSLLHGDQRLTETGELEELPDWSSLVGL